MLSGNRSNICETCADRIAAWIGEQHLTQTGSVRAIERARIYNLDKYGTENVRAGELGL